MRRAAPLASRHRPLLHLVALFALAAVPVLPGPAAAQRTPPPRFAATLPVEPVRLVRLDSARLDAQGGRSTTTLVLAGLASGVAGLIVGGWAGAAIETASGCAPGDYFCGLGGAAMGSLVGESLLLPLGVHLANERQARYWPAALASVGVTAVGLVAVGALIAAAALDEDAGGEGIAALGLLVIPVGQLAASIAIERAGERRRR